MFSFFLFLIYMLEWTQEAKPAKLQSIYTQTISSHMLHLSLCHSLSQQFPLHYHNKHSHQYCIYAVPFPHYRIAHAGVIIFRDSGCKQGFECCYLIKLCTTLLNMALDFYPNTGFVNKKKIRMVELVLLQESHM